MKVQSVFAVVDALQEAGVRYLIVGGLAVVAHGYIRYTMDLDLVVALDSTNAKFTVQALGKLGYHPRVPVQAEDFANPQIRETWVREKGMVVFQMVSDQHAETPVDLFVTMPFDFEEQFRQAAVLPLMEGRLVRVLALNELLAMKQQVARPKDLLDIAELKKIRPLS